MTQNQLIEAIEKEGFETWDCGRFIELENTEFITVAYNDYDEIIIVEGDYRQYYEQIGYTAILLNENTDLDALFNE